MIQTWSSVTIEALQDLWQGFIKFLPKLVGAVVIFLVGWLIAIWVGKLVAEILRMLKLDKIFEKEKWQEALERAEFKMKVSEFLGAVVKWILLIVFLLAAVRVLGLNDFALFLASIVAWLPNLVVAVAIFVVAVIAADFSEKIVKAFVGRMEVGYTKFAGAIVKWAIWVFAILAILLQLGVARTFLQILIIGFVALLVLSLGIAFGLGGKDLAREILENLRKRKRD